MDAVSAVVGSDLSKAEARAADADAQLDKARQKLAKEERRRSDAEADLAAGKGDAEKLAEIVTKAEEAARPLRTTVAALASAQAAAAEALTRARHRAAGEDAEKLEAASAAAVEKDAAKARQLLRQLQDLAAGDFTRAAGVLAARRAAGMDPIAAPALDLAEIVRQLNRELTDEVNREYVEEHLGTLLVRK